MKNPYHQPKFLPAHKLLWLLLIFILLMGERVNASHFVGGDIEYTCTGPRMWTIKLTLYRDCNGCATCFCASTNCVIPMTARPNTTLNPPSCNAPTFNFNVTLTRVEDIGKDVQAICGPQAKNRCNNLGLVQPNMAYTKPSIEKYILEGTLNLNVPSLNSSTCTYWDVYYEDGNRNAGINNLAGSAGQSFRIGCTINIFNRSTSPCINNSPIIKNEPVVMACSGQEYYYNMGAKDPDNDSLSYEIGPAQQLGGGNVIFQPPFSAVYPFPLNATAPPHINYPQPFGPFVIIDSTKGDISFNAVNNTPNYIYGDLCVYIKQWTYDANGNPLLVGITQRDLQIYVGNCPSNNPPRFATIPSGPGNRPQYDYTICAGEQLCFTIIAKDTDVYPNIPRADTTYISWDGNIVRPGKLSFQPTYPVGSGFPRPREDSWQFCWQTEESDGRTLPYYFTVKGMDNYCDNIGQVIRAFSIKVLPVPKAHSIQTDLRCGRRVYTVFKSDPKQSFGNVTLEIAANPFDYTFSGGKRTITTSNPNPGPNPTGPITAPRPIIRDTFTYTRGGKYFVRLTVSSAPDDASGRSCTRIYTDTFVVDTQIQTFVDDTFTCKGSTIQLSARAKWGTPPYMYRWFRTNTNGSPILGPSQTANAYVAADIATTKYIVRISDFAGCSHTDSMILEVKNLPVPNFAPDSARICAGQSFTLNPGNNAGNVASYKWYKNGVFIPADTTQSVVKKDSGYYVVLITDTFGCRQRDTFDLRVNAPVVVFAGGDTSVCPKDTVKIGAIGGYKYKWDRIQGAGTVNVMPKGYIDSIRVAPNITSDYIVTAYYSYPDTTTSYLECSNTDTIRVVARPLPNLSPTTPQTICVSTETIILPFRNVSPANQQGGVGAWSFAPAPGAISVSGPSTSLIIDSLPNLPRDTFYAAMINNHTGASKSYYIKYAYRGPASAGACLREDSTLVKVMALPKISAGADTSLCINNSGSYPFDSHNQFPPDASGKNGVWSVSQGGGLVTTVVSPAVTKYSFNPKAPNVNIAPQVNILTYRYTINYNLTNPTGTLSCANTDSTIFTVLPTPVINAGTDFAICKNEPIFPITTKAGATTSTTVPGTTRWVVRPNQTPDISSAIVGFQNFNPADPSVPLAGGTWSLIFSDGATGCFVYDTVVMEIIKTPEVDITYATPGANDSVCKTTPNVQFAVNASPAGGVGNYAGTAVSATGLFNVQDPAVIPQNTYEAIYAYAVTKRGTTCTGADTIKTFVQAPPVVNVTNVNPKCSYDTLPFQLNASTNLPVFGLKWTHDGAGSFDNDISLTPKYTFSKPADVIKQFVLATATSTNNGVCPPASAQVRLDINPMPVPDFTCDSCEGCVPLKTKLAAKGSTVGGSTYKWFRMDGNTEIPFAPDDSAINNTINAYGKIIIKLKVITPAGCTNEAFDTITAYAIPEAAFFATPESTTIAKPFFSFTNTSIINDNQSLKYEWNVGPDPTKPKGAPDRILTDQNPLNIPFGDSIAPQIPVYLKVISQPGGCVDTAIRFIRIDPDITVFIPSAFRPVLGANSAPCADPSFPDDCNRVFRVYAKGFSTIEVYVFNRWGQQVFATTNPDVGWNGQVNNSGAECPQDVYIYQVNATSFNGKKYTYSGSITLLR